MKRLLSVPLLLLCIADANAGPSCKNIVARFHQAQGNVDDYIQSFPRELQHDVLVCLRRFMAKPKG